MNSKFLFDELDGWRHGDCAFSIDTLGLRVASPQSDAPFNKPEHRDTKRAFPLQGRYAHELDHLFRSVGTSWGLLCHILLSRSLHFYTRIISECDLAADLGESRFADFVQDIRRKGISSDAMRGGKPASVGAYTLTRELELRRTLMGYAPVGPIDETGSAISRLWQISGIPQNIEQCFVYPPNEYFAGQSITAESVLEGLAILKESVIAEDCGEAQEAEVLNNADTDYTFALSYARDLLSDCFDWDYQPVELEAALNLALWVPITPNGVVHHKTRAWADIEVGHRFVRIIGWLRNRGTPLTPHDDLDNAGRDQLFRDFFDEASSALNWPSPIELASDWEKHLRSARPWTRTECFWWCMGEKRLRTSAAVHLLSEFQAAPYMSWFTSSHHQLASRPSFNFVQYDDLIEIHAPHCDASGSTLSARLESYVFLGMLLVLGFRRSIREEDREILQQHFRIVPQLIDEGQGREMAVKNCAFIEGQLSDVLR